MDLTQGVLLRLLLLASSLGPGAVPLRAAHRKPGNALGAPGSITSGAPRSPSLARTQSGQRTASLTPDQRHLTGFFSAQSREKTPASPSPSQDRRFQGYLFVKRMIYFPDTVEVEGSVFDHRELRVGAAITLSQLQGLQLCKKSQTAPPVSLNSLLNSYCSEPSDFLLSV